MGGLGHFLALAFLDDLDDLALVLLETAGSTFAVVGPATRTAAIANTADFMVSVFKWVQGLRRVWRHIFREKGDGLFAEHHSEEAIEVSHVNAIYLALVGNTCYLSSLL